MATWYNRMLAGTFPNYYFKRARALAFQAKYDAERPSRLYKRKTESRGPNAASRSFHSTGRYIVREMEQNSDMVVAALDVFAANIVAGGLVPDPLVLNKDGTPNKEINDRLADLHMRWCRKSEISWQYDDAYAQWLMCRAWARDGEVLSRHFLGTRNNLAHGGQVPYSYQLLEADYLVTGEFKRQNDRRVEEGVEFTGFNRPSAFYLYRDHPHDYGLNVRGNMTPDTVRVPAERMTHLKQVQRIGQTRGVTRFASVIKRLNDVNEIDETERVAARVAAAFAAVITKGDPGVYDLDNLDDDSGQRELKLRPGMIFDDLRPGENVESIGSNRPNNELIPFRGSQLRAGAGGFGISYSSWSKDYNGTYSSQRQELTEQHRLYTPVWTQFVNTVEYPKWQNFVDAALGVRGLVKMTSDVDLDTLYDALWTQPAMPWIQPQQEASAWVTLLDADLETKGGINRLRGKRQRDVARERLLEEMHSPAKNEQEPEPQEFDDDEEMVGNNPQQGNEPGASSHIRGIGLGGHG